MTSEEFKEYLDMIVEKSFKLGVAWKRKGNDLYGMKEAIEDAKKEILERKERS